MHNIHSEFISDVPCRREGVWGSWLAVAMCGGATPGSNGIRNGMVKLLLRSTHAGDIKGGGQNRQMDPHRGTIPWLAIHLNPALMIMYDAVNGG
jgi:hypothetical protein